MKLKYKKLHKEAKLMAPCMDGDAGYDIGFVETGQKEGQISGQPDQYGNLCYYTGIAIQMPETGIANTVMACIGIMKSSGSKKNLIMSNCVGLIDFGFRGEIIFKFKPTLIASQGFNVAKNTPDVFEIGEFVGQLLFVSVFTLENKEVNELSETKRGCNSYGAASEKRNEK